MNDATRKITIDPVTRVEGHGRVTVHMDSEGKVQRARFHIVEFRGFERFIQGHPYWEAPLLVQRLCGICPVSHLVASSKACARSPSHGMHHGSPRMLSPSSQDTCDTVNRPWHTFFSRWMLFLRDRLLYCLS